MTSRSVVFAEPVRTAVGTFGGTLKDVPAPELGAVGDRRRGRARRPSRRRGADGVMGNVVQAGEKMNPARQAAVHAGLPVTVPAMTVNRVCGSGAQAIVSAAQEILLGNIDVAVAGGMENMDQAPYLVRARPLGLPHGRRRALRQRVARRLERRFSDAHSGWHTEDLVEKYQVTRDAQDRWALRSQQRFAAAQAAGHFKSQIVPVEVPGKKGPTQFDKDEANRPDTTLEALARLKPAFRPNGTITAGNAPGLNDAAAAMVLADDGMGRQARSSRHGAACSYGIAAVEPGMFGLGPIPAVRQALQRAGWDGRLGRARRDQRGVRGDRHRGRPRARISRRHRQRRRRRRRPRPSDRRNRRGADHKTHPLDAPRRPQARRGHAVHRRRAGHRAGDRDAALSRTGRGRSRVVAVPVASAARV